MATKKFRAEFLREKRDNGWVHEKPIPRGDIDAPRFEVVFRDAADGKYYAIEYYNCLDVGADIFDGASDDDLYLCYEVEKKEVVTVSWEKV